MALPTILIADDEPLNIDYLFQELDDGTCALLKAGDGREALDLARARLPDLLLLDIMMPVLDGFTVLRELKAGAATRDIPVIIISAASDLRSVVRGIELGADDFLPKPFEPVLLHARIASALEKKRLQDLQRVYLKSLERELEIGREIQRSFLPAELPALPGWQVAACLHPAREVAGDFYDAFILPDGRLAFVLGDVCGKGVGPALFMTLFRSLLRAGALNGLARGVDDSTRSAAERLRRLVRYVNDYVSETHESAGMFTTLFIAFVDPLTGTMCYANCGCELPLLQRGGGVIEELVHTGPVVGILPEAEFTTGECMLHPGDTLLAFSDGATDALDTQGAVFGAERLREALAADSTSSAVLLGNIEAALQAFTGGAAPFDDITLLAVRRDS